MVKLVEGGGDLTPPPLLGWVGGVCLLPEKMKGRGGLPSPYSFFFPFPFSVRFGGKGGS